MDAGIVLILGQDGITSGAIYALLAIALVLIFSVTRVIFIPQGEFIAFAALTLAALQSGKVPGTVWLLVAMGAFVALIDGVARLRDRDTEGLGSLLGWNLAYPLALAALLYGVNPGELAMPLQIALTLAILVPLGPMIYRIAYQPIADTSVLVLLIASVAVHLMLTGLGLVFFGAEGVRTAPFSEGSLVLGEVSISLQTLWVVGCSLTFIVGLYAFFARTIYGKALRATAVNQSGAKLMGISPVVAGKLTFLLAALLGVFSGLLIGPITTIYYDTGFLIGLKGFVAAIIGGLASYPLAAGGAVLVGLLEAGAAAFFRSGFRHLCIINHHLEPGQLAALAQAQRRIAEAHGPHAVSLPAVISRRWGGQLGAEFRSGACHAGRYEGSLVLAVTPERVDLATAASLPEVAVSLSAAIGAGATSFVEAGAHQAYTGSPQAASAAEGASLYAVLATMVATEVLESLEKLPA